MEHANYMVQNQGTDAMAGLNPHTPAAELARRERRGCGMCWLFPATKLRPPYQSLRFWKCWHARF